MNNFYFYRLEGSTSHVFIAWDEDNAFLAPDFLLATRLDENVLSRKTVLQLPVYTAQYYAVLLEAATSASGWMQAEMDRQFSMIAAAMQEDTVKPYTNAEHAAARDTLLAYGPARVTYVRCEVAKTLGTPRPAGCS